MSASSWWLVPRRNIDETSAERKGSTRRSNDSNHVRARIAPEIAPADYDSLLVAPPTGRHLRVARIVAGAEREVLEAVRAGLDVPHRVVVEADRVPLTELDDLVVDL